MTSKLFIISLALFTEFSLYSPYRPILVQRSTAASARATYAGSQEGGEDMINDKDATMVVTAGDDDKIYVVSYRRYLTFRENVRCKLEELVQTNTECTKEITVLRSDLDVYKKMLQNRKAESAVLSSELEQSVSLVEEQAALLKAAKQQLIDSDRNHTRELFAVFVTTAATSIGVTWLLHKFKIL